MLDDPHCVLGVDRSVSDVELRSAYRRRALETHPDKGGTAEAFRQVMRAFEILGDSVRRAAFENARRHMGKPANAAQSGNAKRSRPEKRHASPGAPFEHTKRDKAPRMSSSRAPSAAEANSANNIPPREPTHAMPTVAPPYDSKKFNVAGLIQDLYKLSRACWTDRLNKLPDAILVDVAAFLRESGFMEGDGGDFPQDNVGVSGGTRPDEQGGGEEIAGGAMVSLVVSEEGSDEKENVDDSDVDQANQNDGVGNDSYIPSEGSTAMLALDWWDEDDAEGGGSNSENELVSFDDDDVQAPHTPAKEAKETIGGAIAQLEVAAAVAAATPTNQVTNSNRTRNCGGVSGACETSGSSKLPQSGRANTKFCGMYKTPSGAYVVKLSIKHAALISNSCHGLNAAIDIHIYLVRLRQSMIEKMQKGIEFAEALRGVDALVTAERPHFENHVLRISYRVSYCSRKCGKMVKLSAQSQNVESAIQLWKENHQALHEVREKRRAEQIAIKTAIFEKNQRRQLERKQKVAQEEKRKRICHQFAKPLLLCVRRVLGSRTRQREKALVARWGVRSLPEGVEPASLHQTDDCVRVVLQLSDGSVRRGPLRQSLKDAEIDAEDLARLQSRRGDAAACAELERRDVEAMTGYFLELA
eukprot:TRINITY_DN14367_c0_g2_i1.p1 TRINITY_DN14367_c0_g2~~TRINITY_DN14367_c0_g2_i1.p1  ORF type:complete len:694 (+),score=125.82 TRINITY_DN14367_c0_g2_i1:157-2082(+)